jgi:hypothetical protein
MKSLKLCFVAMPFREDSESSIVWREVIRGDLFASSSPLSHQLRCVRADELLGSRPIMQDVREHIADAHVVIADLTDSNPNVYYELGLAHELHKPSVLIVQRGEHLPFDISHLRAIRYTTDPVACSCSAPLCAKRSRIFSERTLTETSVRLASPLSTVKLKL